MSESWLRTNMERRGSETIKDYLESYPAKIKIMGMDERCTKMLGDDTKILRVIQKERKIIINKGMFNKKFEFDDSQIDDLSFHEMHAIIRNFSYWAAKSPGEKGENYYIRTKMIDKIIELIKYADDVHTGFECEGEEPIIRDLLHFDQSVTANKVKEVESNLQKINEEYEAKRKENEEKRNQLKIEMAEKVKNAYENVEGIDKFNQEALEGKYSIGMPAMYLTVIFLEEGAGANKKESVSEDGVQFTVEYESLGENSRGTVKYKKEFKVENELIVGWKDIN
tara:strand:+ start:174 stop:1016 length:843 start_codon:yes stop_codon:yes gene_type:complete